MKALLMQRHRYPKTEEKPAATKLWLQVSSRASSPDRPPDISILQPYVPDSVANQLPKDGSEVTLEVRPYVWKGSLTFDVIDIVT